MAIQVSRPIQSVGVRNYYPRAKRVMDVAIAIGLLLVFGVAMLLIMMCIWLDSEGPIFYKSKRVGADGVEFEMLKFRSMTHRCDDAAHRQAVSKFMNGQSIGDPKSTSGEYKLAHDPRITRIGHFIRRTSLDELPQLWNVLRGDMSMVGPRPPVPYEVTMYNSRAWLRLAGKPGLTGPWQVYGRSTVPFDEMVEMDISYLHSQSLLYDLKLMVLTAPAMISGRGAG